ncbi:adenylate/guanylate cyclase domain-containing protein [Nocardioides convexus]|uniref:adenylate/guanylate cyclase domain-containing protein n=1 Tax=Nocardioides convexus TaxID=2712224 RepID=UPI0024186F65|nr:adenylate/guanylate cyclase domain-containing protein [Nocardioides convexus]
MPRVEQSAVLRVAPPPAQRERPDARRVHLGRGLHAGGLLRRHRRLHLPLAHPHRPGAWSPGWSPSSPRSCRSPSTAAAGSSRTSATRLLIVADSPEAMADIALELTGRGADPEDPFPAVRAGVAYGEVVTRLGDVFGPVVNIAARLTSVARPSTVLVDLGTYEALSGRTVEHDDDETRGASYRFRRLRRISVKGYSRLKVWALQPAR